MNQSSRFHPLDKLIPDNSICLLEAMVPFVDYQYKLPLVFFIKYRELTIISQCLSNREMAANLGFDCHPENQNDFFNSLIDFMPNDFGNSFNQLKQAMSMMELMNTVNQNNNSNTKSSDNTSSNTTAQNSNNNDSLYENIMSILNEGDLNV